MPWRPLPLSYAVAIYPFQPSSSPAELPLQIGDQLYVIEQGGKDDAWCRGYLVQSPSLLSALTPNGQAASDARVFSGVFPRCCIDIREELGAAVSSHAENGSNGATKPQAPVPMLKVGDESATSLSEPLVDEISSCLREWYALHIPGLVLAQNYTTLDQLSQIVTKLDYARRELLNDVLTNQERSSVQSDAVWDLVRGNKLLDAEVIVRDPKQKGRLLTVEDSAVEMTNLQAVMSVLHDPPVAKAETSRLHHCSIEVKSAQGSDTDPVNLSLTLYEKTLDGKFSQISETFTTTPIPDTRVLFADLSAHDVRDNDHLFLVAKASVPEPPRYARTASADQLPTRNGTLRGTRDSILNRRRSNLVFGSKRSKDKPQIGQNGKVVPSQDQGHNAQDVPQTPTPGKKKSPSPPIPRTVAVAIADIASLIRSEKEHTLDLRFWKVGGEDDEEEQGWPTHLKHFLSSPTQHFISNKTLSTLSVELRPHMAPDAETLIKMNPTAMHMITKSQKIGFAEAPTQRRSDIYLTLGKVIIKQNGSFSHPEFGSVPVKPAPMLNLQLTMELRDSNGRRLERCIFASANGPAVTALRTNAVELYESWDQTLCIRLPPEKVADAHIVLSVADAPGFPFALAWMPLWDKHAFVHDGDHSLILHAYDKSTSTFSETGKGMYLSLPWNHDMLAASKDSEMADIASLQVVTQLVSTEFSQDRVLTSLFNWRTLSSASLLDSLQKLVFVPEIEVVKQLNEVLDGLFAILENKAGVHKVEDLIFNDIVWVLGIVHDRRFNLGPLVEKYADDHFRAPVVAPSLVRSFTRLLQSVSDPQSARDMRALFKVGKQFMRLLMASYWQQQPRNGGSPAGEGKHRSFKDDMKAVFFGLQMMMRSETPALVGSKTLLIQNFHSWLPELLTVYSREEVINIAVEFVDASEESTGKLALYRLVLIINYTRLDQIWVNEADWEQLVKHCGRWLSEHWPEKNNNTDDWRDQVRLCCTIVSELLARPVPALHGFMPTLVSTYLTFTKAPHVKRWSFSLLFPTTFPFSSHNTECSEQFDETLLELSAIIAAIIKIKPVPPKKASEDKTKRHIMQTLQLVQSLISGQASPKSWLSLHVYHHAAATDLLEYVAHQLQDGFLPEPEEAETFEMELWKLYLDTLLSLVMSPALTLETFSEQKRRAVWKIAGDVRQRGADLLRASWAALGWTATEDDLRRYDIERLGGYQVQYVPSLVGPVIALCLCLHEGLRRVGVDILQAMIISEWALSEDLSLIETEVIGALNTILKAQSADAVPTGNEIVARKLFVGELLDSFNTIANQPNDDLWTTLEDLVSTIEELIDLLSSNQENSQSEGVQTNGNDRVASSEIPGRSISRLEGKVHGTQALEVYKQLAEEYERTGDYKRLAKTHRAMARIHEARALSRLGQREEEDIEEDDYEDREE